MLKRKVYKKLQDWKKEEHKKALCVIGARQIGKTTIIREFAREYYENFIELNFILDRDASRIFDGNMDAETIIQNLTAYKMQQIVPGKTLIFLDEIQECPNARCAIKFLVEDGRCDYIESGAPALKHPNIILCCYSEILFHQHQGNPVHKLLLQ